MALLTLITKRFEALCTNFRKCEIPLSPSLCEKISLIVHHQFGIAQTPETYLSSERLSKPLTILGSPDIFVIYSTKGPSYYLTLHRIVGGVKKFFSCVKIRHEFCHTKRGLLTVGPELFDRAPTNIWFHRYWHKKFPDYITEASRIIGGSHEFMISKVKYYPGSDLKDRLLAGLSMTEDQLVNVATQLGRMLLAFHKADLCLGDLKPDNLVQDGDVWKLVDTDDVAKFGDLIGGTRSYSSPESHRFDGDKFLGCTASAALDIFSFGCCLDDMLQNAKVNKEHYDELVKVCKAEEPRARPSANGILLTLKAIKARREIP